MKSLEIISASNTNPRYLDCVRSFIEFWLLMNNNSKYAFKPKVILVGKEIPENLLDLSDFIEVYDPKNLSSVATSQIIRLLLPSLSEADYVMTSDIDMLPLNNRIEIDILSQLDLKEEVFVNMRDVLPPGQFPICYNIATPEVWAKATGIDGLECVQPTLEEIMKNYSDPVGISDIHGGASWYMDQEYLYSILINTNANFSLWLINDSQTKHRRLDRIHHRFPLNWMVLPLVASGFYHDYHVHHPITRNLRYVSFLKLFVKFNLGFRRD